MSKRPKNITSPNVRDYFSLVAKLLGDVLVKKSIAVGNVEPKLLEQFVPNTYFTENYRWVPLNNAISPNFRF